MFSVLLWDNVVFLCLMNLPLLNVVFLWICLNNTCFWFPWQSFLLRVFKFFLATKRDVEGEFFAVHLCLLFFPANKHWDPLLVDWFHALHRLREAGSYILVVDLHPPIHIAAVVIHILPLVVGILPQRWESQWSWW